MKQKQIFGIRKLKTGVASVAIAAVLCGVNIEQVQATETGNAESSTEATALSEPAVEETSETVSDAAVSLAEDTATGNGSAAVEAGADANAVPNPASAAADMTASEDPASNWASATSVSTAAPEHVDKGEAPAAVYDEREYIHGVDILDVNGEKLLVFASNNYPTAPDSDEWEHDIYATWLAADRQNGMVEKSEVTTLVSDKYAQEPASAAINSSGQILITAEDAQHNLLTLDQTYGMWDANLTPTKAYGTSLMQGGHSGHVAASGDKFLVSFSEGWIDGDGSGVDGLGTGDDIYGRIINADGSVGEVINTSVEYANDKRDWWPLAAGSDSNWLQVWQRLTGDTSTVYGAMVAHDGSVGQEFVIAENNQHYYYDAQFVAPLNSYLVTGTNAKGGYMTLIDKLGKVVVTESGLPSTVREAQSVVHQVNDDVRIVYPKASQGVAVVTVTPTTIDLLATIDGDHAWTSMGTDGTQVSNSEVLFATGTTEGIKLIRYDIGTDPVSADEENTEAVNLAVGATLSSSGKLDYSAYVTDTLTADPEAYANGTTGLQWVQLDLGAAYDLSQINLWHYFGDGRRYQDVVMQLSADASFTKAVTVFNNDTDNSAGLGVGTDSEYSETSAGKAITFDPVTARYARFYTNGSNVNKWNHYVEIEVLGRAPEAPPVVNLAAGATLSSSGKLDYSAYVTDTRTADTQAYANGTTGLQWVQLDLGTAYDLSQINLWHYFGDGRRYQDVIVQLSNDAAFASGVTTVFNNDTDNSAGRGVGTDSEYVETSAGKIIAFAPVTARYARFYTNGSNVNKWNHYVEIEVYGSAPEAPPVVNLAADATLSSSGKLDNSAYVTDTRIADTQAYANGTTGLQWVQLDLGTAYELSQINLWHYFDDGRRYQDVVVQLSNDAAFASGVTTVFNNDTDNSAGRGVGTDSEYSETSAGKIIAFAPVTARYARFYTNGSNVNKWNHYVEIEVYGSEPMRTETTTDNSVDGTTI